LYIGGNAITMFQSKFEQFKVYGNIFGFVFSIKN